jgi:ethanolamine ammonia-lyase small subunit
MSDPRPTSDAVLSPIGGDPWAGLRRYTSARIAIGRTGGSQPTAAVLDFRLSHARARDAVHAPFAPGAVTVPLEAAGVGTTSLSTPVADRRTYLLRPDQGRCLDAASRARLDVLAREQTAPPDLAIIVSDGLAAAAAERHAAATLIPLIVELRGAGWMISPVFVVPLSRVKVQDEIGAVLGARFALMLLGERPGLGSPDSLGAYFTAAPGAGRTDADRNCVSNIRPEGLAPVTAAAKLAWLLLESARTGQSGVLLKDNQPASALD